MEKVKVIVERSSHGFSAYMDSASPTASGGPGGSPFFVAAGASSS